MKKIYTLFFLFCCGVAFAQTQNWQWVKGSSGESFYRIKAGKTGNVFGMGNFVDTIRFDTITIAKNDLNYSGGTENSFIVKYDAFGNLKWVKDIGDGNFFSFGFCVDSHDNCYVSGIYYDDSCVIGNTILHNPTVGYYQNLFLAKFDSAGNFVWVKQTLNYGSFYVSSVTIDASIPMLNEKVINLSCG
jgi:hypothetical protein